MTLESSSNSIFLSPQLQPITYDQINNWNSDDHLAAFNCFRKSTIRIKNRPYTTKSLGIASAGLAIAASRSLDSTVIDNGQAKQFFEANFKPHIFNHDNSGLMTGYYEPEHRASVIATKEYRYPIYARPDDLVDLDDSNRPDHLDTSYAFGRNTGSGISQYYDRHQINDGALKDRNLEIFWLKDPVDVFFIHIQGSARLILEDGSTTRISYAAKTGHPYTPIGKILANRGELELSQITMDTIREWLHNNSDQRDRLLEENRSYIFFQEITHPDHALGPVAAAGVALTPGRSIAIDHRLHTFATPIWVNTLDNFVDSDQPFERLLISQDTGSAIIGPRRCDLFTGCGPSAGHLAGQLKHRVSMTILVPECCGD